MRLECWSEHAALRRVMSFTIAQERSVDVDNHSRRDRDPATVLGCVGCFEVALASLLGKRIYTSSCAVYSSLATLRSLTVLLLCCQIPSLTSLLSLITSAASKATLTNIEAALARG